MPKAEGICSVCKQDEVFSQKRSVGRNIRSKTISECISQHILEDFLVKHRAEVTSMVLSTFDQENHDRILREYSEKIGLQKGNFRAKPKIVLKS